MEAQAAAQATGAAAAALLGKICQNVYHVEKNDSCSVVSALIFASTLVNINYFRFTTLFKEHPTKYSS